MYKRTQEKELLKTGTITIPVLAPCTKDTAILFNYVFHELRVQTVVYYDSPFD